jgi:4-amino-4-deoxy-L-arabinose transferase-like glycosyltransferase
LLVLFCLGLYLPGMSALPVMDRDEARFAQATRQMIESGDYLRIRFQDEARNRKPAGIYWLQALSVSALSDAAGSAIWPYRLPSLLGALAAVLLTFGMGRQLVGAQAALVAAGLLAASLTLVAEAHLAKTDAVLLAGAAAAQFAFAEIYCQSQQGRRAAWPWALLFWAALGLGALIKGPVVPLLALLTGLALAAADRQARWLKDLRAPWGILLCAAIVGPWLILISRATSGAFLGQSLGQDFFGKLIGAQESHSAPPGAYLLLLGLSFWPGSLFLAPGLWRAWRERAAPAQRFLLAWIVPFWAVLEMIPTKLPHYLLPAYPALALVAAAALMKGVKPPAWLDTLAALLWGAASLTLAALLVMAPRKLDDSFSPVGIVVALVILVGGGALLRRALRDRAADGAKLAIGAVLLALVVLAPSFALVAPALDALWISRGAAALVAQDRQAGQAVVVAGYSEPSLVFLLGTDTKLVDGATAAKFLAADGGTLVLIEGRAEGAFRRAAQEAGLTPREIGRVAGLDYSNGKLVVLTLYTGR